MRRRKLLKATGAAAFAGLAAGCIGEGPGAGGAQTDTEAPTDTETPTEPGTTEPQGASNETDTQTETGDETETGTADGDLLDVDGEIGDTPDNLKVTTHELYRTNGEVGLRGTVQNTGDQPYEWVEVEVTLQDDQGEILYEFIDETEEEQASRLEAGCEWQFEVIFEEAQMSEVSSYSIELDGYQATNANFGNIDGEIDNQDPNLKVLNTHLTRQESQTFVTGSIKNVGQDDIENVEVSVTLYDDDDNQLFDFNDTVEEQEQRQRLSPGQVWEFRVTFQDVDMQSVARYVVTAESSLV